MPPRQVALALAKRATVPPRRAARSVSRSTLQHPSPPTWTLARGQPRLTHPDLSARGHLIPAILPIPPPLPALLAPPRPPTHPDRFVRSHPAGPGPIGSAPD